MPRRRFGLSLLHGLSCLSAALNEQFRFVLSRLPLLLRPRFGAPLLRGALIYFALLLRLKLADRLVRRGRLQESPSTHQRGQSQAHRRK